jgi:hypothetical protein
MVQVCWSGVARLPSPSIIFISCPYHSHLRNKKRTAVPTPASKYNVTADQLSPCRDLSVCRTVIIIGLIAFSESGNDRLALPCSDHKRTTCNSYSDKFSLSSFDDGTAHLTNVLHGLTDPHVWIPCVQYRSNNNNACALFISTVFIHCFPPPLHPPIAQYHTIPPNLLLGAAAYFMSIVS